MKNKTVVIWDWNGTIVDDAFVFVKIMNFFLKEKKLPLINIAKYRDVFEFPLINYYSKLGFDFNEANIIHFLLRNKNKLTTVNEIKNNCNT